MSYDFIPQSKAEQSDERHVELLCKALLRDRTVNSGKNPYAPRESVWIGDVKVRDEETKTEAVCTGIVRLGNGNPGLLNAKELFKPTDAEIRAALEAFREKGWHANYDSDVGYWEVYQGTIALGEYQARFTRRIF